MEQDIINTRIIITVEKEKILFPKYLQGKLNLINGNVLDIYLNFSMIRTCINYLHLMRTLDCRIIKCVFYAEKSELIGELNKSLKRISLQT